MNENPPHTIPITIIAVSIVYISIANLKLKSSNYKIQTNPKFQFQISKLLWYLVSDICLLLVFCYLVLSPIGLLTIILLTINLFTNTNTKRMMAH